MYYVSLLLLSFMKGPQFEKDQRKTAFKKHRGKMENILVNSIFRVSHNFSALSRKNAIILGQFHSLFVNALTLSQMTNFRLFQAGRVCRLQF